MIVSVGKRIIVTHGRYSLSRDADHPGVVTVKHTDWGEIMIPGNTEDAALFIEAYTRCVNEDIKYRKTESE